MMTSCSFDSVDALAFGELPAERAAEVAAHVASCRMCDLQLRRLRADRGLLSARGRQPPPDFGALRRGLEQRLQAQAKATARAAAARRRTFLAGALSAAALLLVTWASPSLRQLPRGGFTGGELAASFMDSSLACRSPARWEDGAINTVESRYGACLLATPRALPDEMALCL